MRVSGDPDRFEMLRFLLCYATRSITPGHPMPAGRPPMLCAQVALARPSPPSLAAAAPAWLRWLLRILCERIRGDSILFERIRGGEIWPGLYLSRSGCRLPRLYLQELRAWSLIYIALPERIRLQALPVLLVSASSGYGCRWPGWIRRPGLLSDLAAGCAVSGFGLADPVPWSCGLPSI